MITLTPPKKWTINSIDIKTALLQGMDLEQTGLVRPLKEANAARIRELNRCINELAEASRYRYLKVREELYTNSVILRYFWVKLYQKCPLLHSESSMGRNINFLSSNIQIQKNISY